MSTWIIGGTSGIGKACFDLLGEHPAVIYATGKEDFDVTNDDFGKMLEEFGYPNRIVYSAGVNHLNWLGKGTLDEHLRVLDVNLFGFIRLLDAAASITQWSKNSTLAPRPNIVAISSDAGVRPLRTSISYCASKAGLDMAVRVAARELGPHGWRINAVAPGMCHSTQMSAIIDSTVPQLRGWSMDQMFDYERSQEVTPGRISPSEVAEAVAFLLDGPAHLNGEILTLNGGR